MRFQVDDFVRGAVGRGREEDGVGEGEDGGGCADAEGEGGDGEEGGAGIAADAAKGFAEVVTEGEHAGVFRTL